MKLSKFKKRVRDAMDHNDGGSLKKIYDDFLRENHPDKVMKKMTLEDFREGIINCSPDRYRSGGISDNMIGKFYDEIYAETDPAPKPRMSSTEFNERIFNIAYPYPGKDGEPMIMFKNSEMFKLYDELYTEPAPKPRMSRKAFYERVLEIESSHDIPPDMHRAIDTLYDDLHNQEPDKEEMISSSKAYEIMETKWNEMSRLDRKEMSKALTVIAGHADGPVKLALELLAIPIMYSVPQCTIVEHIFRGTK